MKLHVGWVLAASIVACKGSSAPSDVAAPAASVAPAPSDAPAASSAAPATSTLPATTTAVATAVTPPPPGLGLPPGRTAGPCSCASIRVGDVYPHQNGHAAPRHDQDATVLSVDKAACTATLKDAATGAKRVEKCDSGFFSEPIINPAG